MRNQILMTSFEILDPCLNQDHLLDVSVTADGQASPSSRRHTHSFTKEIFTE